MDRCPNCRARINDADHCRRCGMSLGLLGKVEAAAEARLADALSHLANGHNDAAAAALQQLLSLRRDPLVEQLLAFAARIRTGSIGIRQESDDKARKALPNAYYVSD